MPHGETEGAARGRRIIPALRIARIESRALDVETTLRLIGNRRQPHRGAASRAVIEGIAQATVEPDAVDEAAGAIGDEELPVRGIEGDVAQARAVVGNICEQADRSGAAVDLPDRARPAAGRRGAEQAWHETRARLTAAQPPRCAICIGLCGNDRQAIA